MSTQPFPAQPDPQYSATSEYTQPYPEEPTPPRRDRRTAILVIVIVIAAIVAAALAGELVVRHKITNALTSSLQCQLGTSADIRLGSKPALIMLIDKKAPQISVKTTGDRFGSAIGMTVDATIRDIELRDSGDSAGHAGSMDADVTWTTAGISSTVQKQASSILISGISTNDDGTIKFNFVGGLASLTARPALHDGTVSLDAVNADILGIGIPNSWAQSLTDVMVSSLTQFPLGLKATSLAVSGDGIRVHVSATNLDLSKSSSGQCLSTSDN